MSTDLQELKALTIDISKWANRNLWPLSSGELAVRPGFNSLLSAGSGVFLGGGSIQNQRTGEAFHYLVTGNSFSQFPSLSVYDENFTLLQTQQLPSYRTPRAICVTQVVDQVCITSPDFPTYWGMVGGGVTRMLQGVSEIDGRTLIDPPVGISVSWGDRLVIASRNLLSFSDPTLPRVFDPANQIDPPGGSIYGLHVSDSGSLIACTTSGVWSLSIDAAASGYIVLGVWQKVTDFATHNYQTTCLARGQLFGLTQRGYRRIDAEHSEEVLLDDPRCGYFSGSPAIRAAIFPDYRRGKMVQMDAGPCVSIGGIMHRTDLETGLKSWWVNPLFLLSPVCCLRDSDGTELPVLSISVTRLQGTSELGRDGSTGVEGGFFGTVSFPPELNPVIRWVDWASDSPTMSIDIDTTAGTPTSVTQQAPLIGTDQWESAVWSEAKMNTKRFDFATRGSDTTLNLTAVGACRRVDPALNAWYKGPGKFRRQ
jgi:hypothetical protein